MAEALQFWQEVTDMSQQIIAECARQRLQKAPACVFITSIVSRKNRISNARVSMAHLRLAAQRVVEGTHRLSSDEEIQNHHDEQAKKREEMKAQEAMLKNQISFSSAPPVPSVSKGEKNRD
jgi:hypothetical protein